MTERWLYAQMHPVGLWTEPCLVTCACGWSARTATCREAQRVAWAHDALHWAGEVRVPTQLTLELT